MALVTTKEMFEKALKGGYAVGAFNVNNMETIQGIVEAAKEESSPLILQVSAGARRYANSIYLKKLVEAAVEESGLDMVLHLDHGDSFEICRQCIEDGFTSVMYDGSKYTFEENIAMTREVVDYAHPRGVVVEAELGTLAGIEDDVMVGEKEATFTDPEKAREFVERTGVDSLAVAIGTSHGAYKFKGEAKLDFARLAKISEMIPDTPLVLHGASSVMPEYVAQCNAYGGKLKDAKGVPEEMLRRAAEGNICKINIDTDIRMAVTAEVRKFLVENPEEFDPRQYLKRGRQAVQKIVQHKMKDVLGCSGKA
ncbi:MAG TPA: class II fructose-1,6-bisphosphate aldolase [Candidatus Copromorpha excrementigallinarum]|uniref:Fructose-bisphosphate aldolase n=1 Tax=Candidatus Allocopromorpha excrementigallinarum TaxID=2840742 RepID=A0A9D1L778_9FIRM|nr:class II fructose-1,6-bisphosphate aldolase [Candidatus Copromorpha excrementigallinarum]